MIICTGCKGLGTVYGGPALGDIVCGTCKGLGAVNGPQEERLIKAVEKVAEELKNLRRISEREERRGPH